MKTKKSIWTLGMMAAACFALSGCSATLFSSSSTTDDLYSTHDVNAIANADLERREQALAQREAELRRQEEAAKAAYSVHLSRNNNTDSTQSFSSVLADNYEDAYERRLKGFSSLSYNVNSVVPNYDQTTSINYVSAYDPAVYNVMVMGDEVWVEPKYVSSLFGTWGSNSSVNLNINLGWGWSSPYWGWNSWYWGYPYYSWYAPYWGWNSWGWNNWYWGWNHYWDPYWHWHTPVWGGGPHYWGGVHYQPRNVVYGKPGNSNYRPSTGYYPNTGSGAGYGGGGTYRRPGSSNSYITTGGTRPVGSNPTTSGGTSYRRGSSGVTINSGSSSSTPSYNNNGTFRRTNTTRSYNSGFSTPSGGGFSSGSRGGSVSGGSTGGGGGYSGGGGGYRR